MRQPAVAGEQDPIIRPRRVATSRSEPSAVVVWSPPPKSPAVYPASGDRPEAGAGQVRCAVGCFVLRVGSAVPGDLLPGDGVEEAVTVVRDDHHQIAAILGTRQQADSEEPSDGDKDNVLPGFGCVQQASLQTVNAAC